MNILVIESRHCHTEIFPTWSKLLKDENLHFWQSHKSAKLNIQPFISELNQPEHTTSIFSPLSRTAHLAKIKRLKPDLIILNSAELNPKAKCSIVELHNATQAPILALCHRKESYQSIIDLQHPHITACTLCERLSCSESSISAVHYTESVAPAPPVNDGLKLIVPGSVAWDRRHYPFLSSIDQALSPQDQIIILGSCSSKFQPALDELLASTTQVEHICDSKPFPEFIKAIESSHAILPLIEPEMPRFDEYKKSLLSGSVNLAIGLHRPMLAHADFLESRTSELRNATQLYRSQDNLKRVIEDLRENYSELSAKLQKLQNSMIERSSQNLQRLIASIL